jgi:phage terminase large subunit
LWNTISISAFDSPNLTGEAVPAHVARSWSRSAGSTTSGSSGASRSPAYQVRVLGQFASTADDTVCSLGAVEAAQERDLPRGEPVELACDVARFGSDETVIAVRHGQRAGSSQTYSKRDTMETAGHLIHHAAYHGATRVSVDEGGLGGGVVDRLREQRLPFEVEAFNGAQSHPQVFAPGEYPNRRSEAWFALSEQLPEIDLDRDEMLLADLVAPSYKFDSSGRRVVEPKDETKKRLGRSPDRGDAFVMLFAPSTPSVVVEDFDL